MQSFFPASAVENSLGVVSIFLLAVHNTNRAVGGRETFGIRNISK